MPISPDVGTQFTSTSGKDLRPSEWFNSYERITYRGEFSGSSATNYVFPTNVIVILSPTFSEIFDANAIKLLYFFHDQPLGILSQFYVMDL